MAGILAALSAGITGNNSSLANKLTGGLFGGGALKAAVAARRAKRAGSFAGQQLASTPQTAGATNMGERINTIESRLSTLESGSDSAGAMQSASEVAPPADMGSEAMSVDMGGGAMPVDMSAPAISAAPQMPAVEEPIIPQSEQLGSLMASPFMVRQRKKMGPLMFKNQTGARQNN